MFAPLLIMSSVLLIVCWILMGWLFCFEIGSWSPATFSMVDYDVSLVDRG